MANPMDGVDLNVLNEAIRYGLEFMEEAERKQRQVQAQIPQQVAAAPPTPKTPHPAQWRRSKHGKGRR